MPPITYVAFLRGINVNGHRVIRMAELRASLEANFPGVKTWMQSGNVLLQSDLGEKELGSQIKSMLRKDFGLDDVPVMIRTAQEVQEAIDNNPFASSGRHEAKRFFVAFLDQLPTPTILEEMNQIDYSPEEYCVNPDLKCIYFYVPDFAKYKLDTPLFEKKLKILATSRNWRTMNKLAEMAADMMAQEKPISAKKAESSRKGVKKQKKTEAKKTDTPAATGPRRSKRKRS